MRPISCYFELFSPFLRQFFAGIALYQQSNVCPCRRLCNCFQVAESASTLWVADCQYRYPSPTGWPGPKRTGSLQLPLGEQGSESLTCMTNGSVPALGYLNASFSGETACISEQNGRLLSRPRSLFRRVLALTQSAQHSGLRAAILRRISLEPTVRAARLSAASSARPATTQQRCVTKSVHNEFTTLIKAACAYAVSGLFYGKVTA